MPTWEITIKVTFRWNEDLLHSKIDLLHSKIDKQAKLSSLWKFQISQFLMHRSRIKIYFIIDSESQPVGIIIFYKKFEGQAFLILIYLFFFKTKRHTSISTFPVIVHILFLETTCIYHFLKVLIFFIIFIPFDLIEWNDYYLLKKNLHYI